MPASPSKVHCPVGKTLEETENGDEIMSAVTETPSEELGTHGLAERLPERVPGSPLSGEPRTNTGLGRECQLTTFSSNHVTGTVLRVWGPDCGSWLGSKHVTLRQRIAIHGWIILRGGECPVHCKMLSRIPDPHPTASLILPHQGDNQNPS